MSMGEAVGVRLSRRGFFETAAATAMTVAGTTLLAACGGTNAGPSQSSLRPSTGPSTLPSASGSLKLPTSVPLPGLPQPDLPASADGFVPPAYSKFPATLLKSVSQPVGKGEDFTILTSSPNPAPPTVDQNAVWAQVNKEIGLNLKFPIIATTDYNVKLNAIIASGDLPDLIEVSVAGFTAQNLPAFLQAQCADLTLYLSGDGIKQFPNLANFPASAWPSTVFNNAIYAVPLIAGGIQGRVLDCQQKAFDSIGVTSFNSIDDFTRALKQLTIPGQRYGIGGAQYGPGTNGMAWFLDVFGAPNVWANNGGKLTKDWETDEFKATVAFERSMWDSGVMHPDSPTLVSNGAAAQFYAGKFVTLASVFQTYQLVWDRTLAADATFKTRSIVPFSHDGKSKPRHSLGTGASGLVAVKKGTPERIKQALGVLNYLAAPFGSQEYLLLNYGVKGTDYTTDAAGNPSMTAKGMQDLAVPWKYVVTGPDVLYDSKYPDFATIAHQEEMATFSSTIANPVVGLYSKTDSSNGAVLSQKVSDAVNQIIYGRADIGTLDAAVKDWRAGGGDQIRTEYEQALQDSTR